MIDLLPPLPLFTAFLAASLLLAISPGPGVLFIVTRSLVQGRRAGLVSVAGVALGNLGNALAAAGGLAALFAASTLAFEILRAAGALYLIILGIRMLRADQGSEPAVAPPAAPLAAIFREGLVVALLNPKTTLFFAAFLPQFLAPSASPMLQASLLGVIFVAIAAVTDSLYALAAGLVAPTLKGSGTRRLGRQLGGSVFIGLGIFAALSGSRSPQ